MQTIEIIGLIAATCTTAAFVPQVYKALKEKSTADISLTMYVVLFIGLILWLIYGIYHESLAIILANTITGVLVIIMLALKIKHK
ncbi:MULTISPECIES: SemiSWEET family sugar transporter [Croceitalea]|uniref:SemiSWEET transporter n=1 Tax=Croceitalea vernalis TaxID=3075599 RepID=A0ABU3BCE6_9FLAO|nr:MULTISPECIES: SemiSWEET transporter [unclassified Croceitalea]MDT0538357.1 SemiSWEET transporter [Croceitalea sp. P059]MDT0620140.1 SemiSWEET transporter [Croceitalea sp. P007]